MCELYNFFLKICNIFCYEDSDLYHVENSARHMKKKSKNSNTLAGRDIAIPG